MCAAQSRCDAPARKSFTCTPPTIRIRRSRRDFGSSKGAVAPLLPRAVQRLGLRAARQARLTGLGPRTFISSKRRFLLPLGCRSQQPRKPRSLFQRIPDGLNGLRQMAANKQIINADDRNRLTSAEPAEGVLHRHIRCNGRTQRYPRLPPRRSPGHKNRYTNGGSLCRRTGAFCSNLLYYQPFVTLESGFICGFEALLRWHHPQRGMVASARRGDRSDCPDW
jgi:hypothetical protein